MSSVTTRGFDAWKDGPQHVHMQRNTSIWDVALQVIIAMLEEHMFNAQIVIINGYIILLFGRAICFAAASRIKIQGRITNYD